MIFLTPPVSALPPFVHQNAAQYSRKIQRMDAALRSARHDARLLSNHLKRSLGKGDGPLAESTARTAATFLLAQGNTHGDLDTDKALRLSRLPTPPLRAQDTAQNASGDAMNVEGDVNTDPAAVAGSAGSIGGVKRPSSSIGKRIDHTEAVPSGRMAGLSSAEIHDAAAAGTRLLDRGQEPASDTSCVVDRERLIAILEAEERVSAMANHLGSADPMTHLRSLLLPEASSAAWFSRSVSEVPGGNQSQGGIMGSSRMVLCELSGAGEAAAYPREHDADGFPRLDGVSHPNREQEKPAQRKQRRSRSAEDFLPSSSKMEPWDDSAADELYHGRKKRSREVEAADHGERVTGPGSSEIHVPQSGLVRSSSFTTNQRQEMTAPEAGVTGGSSCCSLPKLKASRLR